MNRNLAFLKLLTIGLLAMAGAARAAEVHVSPAGRDTNVGSADAPLASLEGARQWIAARKLAGQEPVTVWVHGGTYHLARVLKTATGPVTCTIFRAYKHDELTVER